jgi:hypothetical protein
MEAIPVKTFSEKLEGLRNGQREELLLVATRARQAVAGAALESLE